MTLHIREATADDLPQVLALYAQPGLDDGQVMSETQARAIHSQFARYPNYRLFVASDAQAPHEIIGSYALLVMHNLAHRGTPSAIAEDVVVHEARRSNGVGREMMAHAMAEAQAAGCYKLALSSNKRRERAHEFYESLGFERHGYSYVLNLQTP
jgi:GNAT superfamily N-acetyltransferase